VSRNYDRESQDTAERRYAYAFDFEVMHPFILRSFEPFYAGPSVLELGSFRGDFTRRLAERFTDITCVEGSPEAAAVARASLGDRARVIEGTFEDVVLERRFDNVIVVHVLEHLDDPVRVLGRVNREWLRESGRLFLV